MYKLTKEDGFVWEIIQANQVRDEQREVFILHSDDSETLVTDFDNIDPSKVYGVEVDFVLNIDNRAILTQLIVQYKLDKYETKYDVFPLVAMDTQELRETVLDTICYDND